VGLLSKAKAVIKWNRLGIKLDGLKSAVKKEADMNGVDPKIVAGTAAKGGFEGALAVVLPALVAYLSDSDALMAALSKAGVGETVAVLAVPLIVALARAGANYMKHRQ
jgi:hypothetical protein